MDKFLLIHIKKYFLPRIKIENYNIKIDGSQLMTQLNNIMKLEKY